MNLQAGRIETSEALAKGLSWVRAMDIIALASLRIRPAARQNKLEVDPIIRG
jgi:hypothetical protein